MGKRQQFPAGQGIGHGEFEQHTAFGIGLELGKEKRRFGKVFAENRLFQGLNRWLFSITITYGNHLI